MELEAWQAQSVRLTAFPVKPEIELQQSWWKELFGQDPDKVTSQPKQLARLEEGLLDSGLIVLKIQPGRIDWQYGASLDVAEALKQIPTVSNFPDILQLFTPLIEKWFAICPGLERMAFGAVLLQPVEGRPEGYRVLGEYLRDVRVDPQTSDFSYQINKHRECISGIQGLQINRLMKWSVVGMKLELVGESGQAVSSGHRYAARLELDVNTAQEFKGELPKKMYSALFGELIELAREIAMKGDVP